MKSLILKVLPGVFVLLALLIVLLPASCGKRSSTSDLTTPQVTSRGSPASDTSEDSAQSTDGILAELDALTMPPQANPDTWLI